MRRVVTRLLWATACSLSVSSSVAMAFGGSGTPPATPATPCEIRCRAAARIATKPCFDEVDKCTGTCDLAEQDCIKECMASDDPNLSNCEAVCWSEVSGCRAECDPLYRDCLGEEGEYYRQCMNRCDLTSGLSSQVGY